MFKKIFTLSLIVAFATVNIAYAQYSNLTDSPTIRSAIELIANSGSTDVIEELQGKNSSHQPVKIIFYYLAGLNPRFANVHAVATSDNNGRQYILINSKHRNAPPEALACLITHEITHQLKVASREEELRAWTRETELWIRLNKLRPDIATDPKISGELVDRLRRLETLYVKANNSNTLINYEISNNSYYQNLR